MECNPSLQKNRWSLQEKKHMNINTPFAVKLNSQTMGGVNLHDQFVDNYIVRIRSKKLWWPHFYWVVKSSAVNARRVLKILCHVVSLLDFIRECVLEILKLHSIDRKHPCPSTHMIRGSVVESIRKDGINHWPDKGETKYARCRQCAHRTAYICIKCWVPVHPEFMAECLNK